jgi:small subunit ribosomal protein S2
MAIKDKKKENKTSKPGKIIGSYDKRPTSKEPSRKKATESLNASQKKKVEARINILLEDLLKSGCHFGHLVSKVNPRMQEYIFAARDGVHIFDLFKTKSQLEKVIDYLVKLTSSGGKIIFVGTKRQAVEAIKETARETGMFYVSTRWVGGLLTNWKEVKKNLERLEEVNKELAQKDTALTKYELSVLRREKSRLEDLYHGLVGLEKLPDCLFIVDIKREQTAIREAKRMGIKIVGIADTNADPRLVDYVIPANDDAQASIAYILSKVAEAIK